MDKVEENDLNFNYSTCFSLINNLLKQDKAHTYKALVRTYGCQQNVSDSEKIEGMLISMGYMLTDNVKNADIIIFNTCAIREHAEDRVFGNVGALKSLKKENPNLIIAICGCMIEQSHVVKKLKESYPFVDLVFSTNSLYVFPKLIYDKLTQKNQIFYNNKSNIAISEDLPIHRKDKVKALIPIMYGCDNFCSYCIVPYVKGRERSRNSNKILSEFNQVIKSGYKDITFLGQNVNSYGKNLNENINFAELLKKLDSVSGNYWIRFMTSHPKDVTKELIDTIASGKHICHHLHLPFQSGSNRILKLMNRHYTAEKYLDIINYVKKKIPGISITSDVIVGFPGETYEDFCETLSLIKKVKFTSLYTFIYSKRNGTVAASMEDPISYKNKSNWFKELLKIQNKIVTEQIKSFFGKTLKVLIETKSNIPGYVVARTQGNMTIDILGNSDLIGKFALIKVTNIGKNNCLKGDLISIL